MLKEVCFLLREEGASAARLACEEACLRLREAGLSADVHSARDMALQSLAERDSLLVLADDLSLIRDLQEEDVPVIAYRHRGCAEQGFPGVPFIFEEPQEVDADSYRKAYQRLAGEPWEILRTARLILRETTTDDLDAFYAIYADEEITRYMEGLFADRADEERYLSDYIRNVYHLLGFGVWTVTEQETGDIIGRAGFSIRAGFDHPEVGFLIGKCWQHKGFAKEALEAVLSYGRDILGFTEVHALVKKENARSVRLLESLGFQMHALREIAEDIYGGVYPGEGKARSAPLSTRKGTYLELRLRY